MSDPKQYHILVIEDEESLVHGIKFNLEAEGYLVTAIGDGQAAMDQLDDTPGAFDLIVLDIMLPGLSGYEICERLRETDLETPVLILSARTLREDQTRAFDVGANQYMVKPFDLDEFLSRINNLLTFRPRRPETPRQEYTFAEATVDFESFEVTVQSETTRLTPLEMKLLRYFIDNADRIIPRSELLENVWELTGNIQTRAPDQFLRRLRKIFEVDSAKPRYFITIRDIGYRFVPDGSG